MQIISYEPIAPTGVQLLDTGEQIDLHRHDQHQLVYAAQGLHTVTTELAAWFAPHDRAIWVPAGIAHSHRAHGPVELHLVGLPGPRAPLGIDSPVVIAADPLMRELIVHCTRNTDPTPARQHLIDVLLDRLDVAPQENLAIPIPTDQRLRELCEIVTAHPGATATLQELGKRIGASERTLSRLFRDDLGMSFVQWRTQARLLHALTLLSAGVPVSEVAVQSGWSTASTFIGVYRKAFNATPGQSRRLPSWAKR